jgi:hypothetical protein
MRIRILQNSFGSLWIRIWMRIHNTDKNSRAIFPFSLCGCGGDLLSRSYIIYVLYIHPLNFSLFAAFSFLLFVSFFLHDRVCVGIVCWPYFFSFFLPHTLLPIWPSLSRKSQVAEEISWSEKRVDPSPAGVSEAKGLRHTGYAVLCPWLR